MKKIGLDMGHTITGLGTGAVSIVKETDINRKVGKLLIGYLQQLGVEVIDCTVDSSSNDLRDRTNIAIKHNVDLFVSIHCNSGGGHGTETYLYDGNYKNKEIVRGIAKSVNDAVVNSCGFRNRGVKEGNFYVIRETSKVNINAILVELFFVDSQEDCGKYNLDNIAKAIAQAIAGKALGSTPSVPSQNSPNISVGTKVKITGSNYATGETIPQWVKNNTYSVIQKGDGKSLLGDIVSWVYDKDLSVVGTQVQAPSPSPAPQVVGVGSVVKVIGNNYATGQIIPQWVKNNSYTITQDNGDKVLLSDIVSWVYKKDVTLVGSSNAPVQKPIAVGSVAKIVGSNYATGQTVPQWVKNNSYKIIQISGEKVLLDNIMSWVYKKDIKIV